MGSIAGASSMSNVDLLIRSSDYLEATELRHAEFKRQIKREMLSSTLNEDSEMPSSSEIDEVEDDGSAPSGSEKPTLRVRMIALTTTIYTPSFRTTTNEKLQHDVVVDI